MGKIRISLSDDEAQSLGIQPKDKTLNEIDGKRNPRYCITQDQWDALQEQRQADGYVLKSFSKNKDGVVTAEKYGKKQNVQEFDKQGFAPVSFTTNPFGEGAWVKYDLPAQERLNALKVAVDALKEEIEPAAAITLSTDTFNANLINQYTLTDYHLGMMAWGEESGDNWDLKIAERVLVNFFKTAIEQSPNAKECVFAQIGDFLHWDGLDAVTPAHKHLLDADTRFSKLVRVAIRVLRNIISMLLEKYETVTLITAEGNHDPASSIWLREVLSAFYENETRLKIDNNPDPYYCVSFGDVCLFYHHGHKRNIKSLDSVFVSKFKKEFGKSKYVYAHTGHFHNDLKTESNLMILEQHRTLAAKDAYASRGGYCSDRDSKVITYHKHFGEVKRATFNINMLK